MISALGMQETRPRAMSGMRGVFTGVMGAYLDSMGGTGLRVLGPV